MHYTQGTDALVAAAAAAGAAAIINNGSLGGQSKSFYTLIHTDD